MAEMDQIYKAMSEGLKSLSQAIAGIADKVDQMAAGETKAAPKAKTKTKAKAKAKPAAKAKRKVKKTAKKAPPKKKVAAKAKAKKPKKTAKKPRKPAARKSTALAELNALIATYADGVDTNELKAKTGFDDKKIHNIVYKLKKQGQIKTLRKGIYVST